MESQDSNKIQQHFKQLNVLSPQINDKLKNLFYDKKSKAISQIHYQYSIIINPKAFKKVIQCNQIFKLQSINLQAYFKIKYHIFSIISLIIQKFPLNSYILSNCSSLNLKDTFNKPNIKKILQQSMSQTDIKQKQNNNQDKSNQCYYQIFIESLVFSDIPNLSFFQYCVKEYYYSLQLSRQKSQSVKQILQKYSKILYKNISSILTYCTLYKNDLQFVTQSLTNYFYPKEKDKNLLTFSLIRQNFQLFSKSFLSKKDKPYIYFLKTHTEGVKVLLKNNKWNSNFSKGFTIFIWFKIFQQAPKNRIFLLKNDTNGQIQLSIQKNGILTVKSIIKSGKDDKNIESENVTQICPILFGTMNLLGIQFAPVSQGLFKASQYQLNIKLNKNLFEKIQIKIPKFSQSEFITDFSLFQNFIGSFHSLLLANRCQLLKSDHLDEFPQGLSIQSEVNQFFYQNSVQKQNILCILNADRSYQGTLINYLGNQNQGCYAGGIMTSKFLGRNTDQANAILPYLYLLNLIPQNQKNNDFATLYDMILRKFLQSMINTTEPQQPSLLFALYFMEISQYAVTSSTIQWLLNISKQKQNFYISIVIQFIDALVLMAKGINIEFGEQNIINPVQKLQLMFYLETKWKQTWNSLQGFEGWWSPSFFKIQQNHPYSPNNYNYIQQQKFFQWSVRNFISNDYCRCILQPLFKIPSYADFKNYAILYTKKQIQFQSSKIVIQSYKRNTMNDLTFNKTSKSRLDRLKNKIKNNFQKQAKEHKTNQYIPISQFKKIDVKQTIVTDCCLITLLTNIIGQFRLTKQGFIIFTMKHDNKKFDHMCIKAFKNQQFVRIVFHLKDIAFIRRRRYNQSTDAIEFKLKNGQIHIYYFYLKNIQKIIQVLEKNVTVRKNPYQYYLQSDKTLHWIDKDLSNFQYLMWLNDAAGRSYGDITQYPVLPWIVVSNKQDLSDNSLGTYRQLQKNMGSIGSQDRIRHFLQKYESYNQAEIFNQYHFGTHYSSSAIIFNYLIRVRPFSQGALTLQSGKFDVADRVFGSYHGSWTNATTSPTDIRQLVPQIYTLPQVMFNKNNYDFGLTQTQDRIDNVELPQWAKNNPFIFVLKLRELLQSPIVSNNINKWIDLIFGFKQRGEQAVKHMNIFFPLTYEDALIVDNIEDQQEKISIETQIAHFGQNPCQIIGNNPHPERPKSIISWQGKLLPDHNTQFKIQKFTVAKNPIKQHHEQFHSVFQGKDSVLSIKFFGDNWLIAIQRHQYCLFKMLTNAKTQKKVDHISKQSQIQYKLQTNQVCFDYRNLNHFVPVVVIQDKVTLIGGFYSGYLQIIFIQQPKFNDSFKITLLSTITALSYDSHSNYLYIGDCDGRLVVYQITLDPKKIEFYRERYIIAHSGRVNSIQLNNHANLAITCGQDGVIKVFNTYSLQLFRVLKSPTGQSISFAVLSTAPLYSIYFYCTQSQKLYSYSINGQYLDSIEEKSGFLYNMKVLKSSSKMQFLSFANKNKQLMIYQTPFLKIRKRIKIRKDDSNVICLDCADSAKVFVGGSQDGFLHLIGDKQWL